MRTAPETPSRPRVSGDEDRPTALRGWAVSLATAAPRSSRGRAEAPLRSGGCVCSRPLARIRTGLPREIPLSLGSFSHDVARADNRAWSLNGAPWWQPVAISGKCVSRENGGIGPQPLPWVATSCLSRSMVSRASAVGCHPLREVPSLRRRRSIFSLRKRQVLRTRRPTELGRGHSSSC